MRSQSFQKTLRNIQVTSLACAGALLLAGLAGCDKGTSPAAGCSAGPASASNPNAEIVLTSPTGCQDYHVGDTLWVKWQLKGKGSTDVNAVDIRLSPDGGQKWTYLNSGSIAPDNAAWENYPWVVTDSVSHVGEFFHLTNNNQIIIQVEQYSTDDPNLIDQTTKTFTVLPKP